MKQKTIKFDPKDKDDGKKVKRVVTKFVKFDTFRAEELAEEDKKIIEEEERLEQEREALIEI